MMNTRAGRLKRFGKRAFRFLLCAVFALQSFWMPAASLADSTFAFRGYGSENVTSSTFNFAVSDANVSGSTVSMDGTADEGSAAGLITLNEGNDISTSVDLGGLEIDFSTVTSVTAEGENGAENDIPTVDIEFCSSANGSGTISSAHLGKSDPAASGSVTLSSGAGIPSGTRSIVIYLTGKNTIAGSDNTVVFSNTSLVIKDSSAPRCTVERNEDWTNQDITVSINASDSDSGLEGIYVNDERKTQTSPYTFVVSENNTSFSAYSMDYAGKKSEVSTVTISNIDKATPSTPGAITLSTTEWSKENVSVTMPALSAGSGAPERYVYQVNAGTWGDMPDGFALSDNGVQNISVAVEDAAGNRSDSVSATAKIDKLPPNIGTVSQTVGSGTAIVSVTATDEGPSGIQKFRYAAGEHDSAFFTTDGSDITGGTFTVHVGGTYTLYAEDKAGNVTLKTTELSTAPVLEAIDDIIMDEDETKTIPLALSDAESTLGELSIDVSTANDALLKTVTVDKTGSPASLSITPALNQSGGPVKVTVTVTDPSNQTVSRFFNVTVVAVNDLPIAVDDSDYTLSEGGMVEIPVLDNDSDAADGDTLSIIGVGAAEHGITMIVLDKIRYTPDQDYAGSDRFTYQISDGNGGKSTATVYVTVENINDAPTAIDDKATTQEDYAVTVPVLANDSDVDTAVNAEETIELVSCSQGAHGTTSVEDGSIVYTPVTNYNGTDSFTYLIRDKAGLTAEAEVSITISPLADDPWFNGLANEYTIDEDSKNQQISFEILDVETPADSLMLQAASLNADLLDQNNISISGLGDNNPATTLSVSPQTNANGDVIIRLTLGDGFVSVVQDVTIHIRGVNDAPIVSNDTITYTEDVDFVDISIASLLSNDRDVENDLLTFANIVTDPSVGTLTRPDSTTLRYTPVKNYDGTDSFTYSVSDGTAQTTATCTLKAVGVNDTPTISTETEEFAGTEDTLIVVPFEMGDNESAASKLEVITASNNLGVITTDGITIQNNNDGTGEVQIQPEADAYGDVQLTLTVSDGEAQSSIEVTVHVAPAQDAPVAVDDNIVIRYSSKRDFNVLTNDHDADGDSLQVTSHAANLLGTLSFDEKAQMFTYRPAIGENGIATFAYVVSDGTDTATGTVTLDVATTKHSPVITAIDTQYVQEDGSIDGVSFNVSDEDVGDTATIAVNSSNTTLLPNDETHISVTDNGNGQYALKLSPEKDKTGSVNITVTVEDGTGLTDSTTFTMRVLAQNDAPVAVADEFSVNEDTSLVLDMLGNDTDPDGDTIWLSSLSTPSHGSIERVDNNYTYVPYEDWYGTETLSYSVSDGRAGASSSMTITVAPVNDTPVAWTDYCALPNTAGISKTIDVLHNDYDVDTGDVLHISQIITAPKYGTAEIVDGKITYTRNGASPEANGADSFVYRIIDRQTATGDYRFADATVYIGVEFHSSLYTYGRKVTCMEDAEAFNFDLSISNPNAVPYTLTVNSTTTLGTFTVVDNDTVRFAPAANQYGYQTITYTIEQTDGLEKDTGTIWLRVYPVNDLPMIDSAPASITMDEDTSAGSTFDVTFHDVDCATRVLYFYVYTTDASTIAPIPFQSGYTVTRTDTGATVTVKTAGNVNGTAKIVVGVSDGMTYDEQTIDLTVASVDDAPIVNDVTRTIYEDSSVVFAAPGSDSEADGDFTHAMIMDSDEPANGTAMIRPNKTIYYMPDENFFGTDEFYVTITDQTATMLSSRAKVTIEVVPVNDQPEISDLGYYQTTLEDTPKDVYLTLTDVDTAIKEQGAFTLTSSNESVVENTPETLSIGSADGNQMVIHMTPKANAYGTTKITLVVSDGALSTEATFELKVIPVNDIPSAVNDVLNVLEAVSVNTDTTPAKTTAEMNLLSNDSDVEDGKPKVISITDVVNGTVTNLGGGKVQVSADGNFSGAVTFTYTVMDLAGAKASATGTLNIAAQNDPPHAVDNSYTINEDAHPTFAVLGNDTDPEGDTLTITSVSTSGHGTATIDGNNILYVPNADYFGTDSFTYTISDGSLSATATVRITIKPINDAPTIAKHSSTAGTWTMDEDTPTAFNFVVADAESPVNRLIIKIVSKDQTRIQTSQIALSTNEAGYKTINVTPVANAFGTVQVTFLVSDGLLTTEETYDIAINSVNDAPVVTAPKQTIKEDEQLTASVTATDSDDDDVTFLAESDPQHGVVTVYANGTYLYQPNPNFNGEDWFDVTADDGQATNNTGVATVYITVKPEGDPPTAADDEITIDEDTPTKILVLANDTDEDILFGDAISVLRLTTPAHGTAEKKDGGILYTPAANYNGTDSFTYTIADKDGKLDTAQVRVTINPVNDAPSNGNDTASTDEDTAVTINATANDDLDETTNPDLELVTITAIDDPAHGTATLSTDKQSILYTPDANWFSPEGSPEVFSYTATDNGGLSTVFTVTVTVNSVNDLPVITPDNLLDVTTNEDTQTSAIAFTVDDVEDDAGDLIVSVTHNNSTLLPAVTLTPNADGIYSFTVTPKANKVGSATFTVTVTDSDEGTDSDTFTMTVNAVNDLPVAVDDAVTVAEGSSKTFDVLSNDDVDKLEGNGGDTLTLLTVGNASYGTATKEGNLVKYVSRSDLRNTINYTDTFTYIMQDASGAQSAAVVTVTVTPVNDIPTISAIANITGVQEDAVNGTGEVSFNVTDEEDDYSTLQITVESSNPTLFPTNKITIAQPATNPDGGARTVKVIPAANQFGTGKITLTVKDSNGATASTSFWVTVDSVNDVPLNGDKSFTVVEDILTQLDVRKDIDPDYATTPDTILVTSIATNPNHGTASVAADGKSVYYTTNKDSNEPDSFQYTVHDSYGDADYTFTVNITVTPVNDAPVVHYTAASSYTTAEATAVNDIPFTVTDVDNVTDAGGSKPVDVTLSAESSNFILLKNGMHIDTLTGDNRDIDLKPYLKWNGSTTVTITATDPGGLKGTASFNLVVSSVNGAPVAVNDTGSILEDQPSVVYVMANDKDEDKLTNPDTEFIKIHAVVDNDSNATIEPTSDGLSVRITPKQNFNGTVSFTYTIEDSQQAVSNEATATYTVLQVNDAPTTTNDTASTAEDTAVEISVLDNDNDIDKDGALNATPLAEVLSALVNEAGLAAPSHGAVTTDGTTVTYTPNTNYNGTDTFEYYCYDGDVKVKGSVSVTISQVNDNPIAVADTAETNEDTASTAIDVLANDTDVDTDAALNLGLPHSRSTFTIASVALTTPAHGSVTITADNKLIFTPATNWFGTEVVNYTMDDGKGGTASSTLTMTVKSLNDLPVFETSPATMELSEDGVDGTAAILVSDVETDADLLSVTVVSSSKTSLIATTDVTITAGTGGNRTVKVNPKNNQNGSAEITLKVTDANSGTATVKFIVNVAAVNDAPTTTNRTINIAEDSGVNTLTKTQAYTDVDVATNADVVTVTIVTQAQHGMATVQADGSIKYQPTANYNGTDSYVYKATDSFSASSSATITYNISQVNDAPTTTNDTASTAEDTAVEISVLDNDNDIDKDGALNATPLAEVLSALVNEAGLAAPTHGTVTSDGTKITYTPTTNYNGTDTFEYYCYDGDVKIKGSVSVTISQVNDAPKANADTAETNEDTATIAIDVLSNDTDVDTNAGLNLGLLHSRDVFTITEAALTTSSHGGVTITADNKLIFTPAQDWTGTEVINYTMSDGHELTSSSTLTMTVKPVNDAPVFSTAPADMNLNEDNNGVGQFVVGDVETAASLLSVVVSNISNTTLIHADDVVITIGTNGNRTITVHPYPDQNGTAVITLVVTDADGATATVTFTVNVTAVNDTPVAIDRTIYITEDSDLKTLTQNAAASDVDIVTNGDELTLVIITPPKHGTANATAEKTITYKPDANFNGTDSFVYEVTDKAGAKDTSTLTYVISQVNDAPVTGNDTAETTEDHAVDIAVLGNDTDIDKDELLNSDASAEVLSVLIGAGETGLVTPSHGAITADGTTIHYVPVANYNGTDTFDYYCSDGEAKTKGTVTVTITQVNDNPVAVADTTTIDEDHATSAIDVLSNDTDIDTNDTLNLGTLHERATFTISAASLTNSEHGKVDIIGNKLVFTPTTNWFGIEVVNYTISDGNEGSANGTLTVTVNSINDLPVYATAPENMTLTEDEANGTSAFVVGDVETAAKLLLVTVSDISNTTLVGEEDITITAGTDGDRTITVNPKENQNGTAEITLLVTDADGGTATVKFTVDVTAVNDTPVVNAAEYDINEDASLQTKLKTNLASDVDIITNADAITLSITSPASHGTAAIDANGNITYIPTKDFNGTDSFEYTATDKAGAHASKTLTFHVAQVNDAPVTGNDTANTAEDNAVVIPVLDNDTDIDKNTSLNAYPLAEVLSVLIGAGETGLVTPSHGAITTDGTTITYTPAADYNGTDTFDYYCSDGEAKTKGTVTVTITQVNDNPVAVADTTTIDEDHATSAIDVLANDTDVDTNGALNLGTLHERASFTISAASLTDSEHGTVAIVDNKLVFTPATNWFGTEVVNYTILDGNEGSASGTLSVTVNSVNDLPYMTMAPGYMYLSEDGADGISQFTVNDVETKASLLSVTVKSSSNPALVATSDITIQHIGGGSRTVTVNPKDDQNGGTLVTLTLEDEDGGKLDITMEVHVAAGNDKPVAESVEYNINEDAGLQTRLKADLTSDVDIATNDDSITLSISIPAAHGTAGIDANGNITYLPVANFNGSDSFEYTATDEAGGATKATLTFQVAPVNDAPETQNDTAGTTEDNAIEIPVLENDSDVDMDKTLNAHPGDESISVLIAESGLTAPSHGKITTDGTTITYTPNQNYNGADTFDYYCYDGELKTKATAQLTITQVNDNPQALADSTTIGEDEKATVDVLANDTDVDTDDTLNLNVLHNRSTFSIQDSYIYGVSHGTILVDGANIVYDPEDDFSGTQVIKYVLSDGHDGTSIGTLTIGVNAENDKPVAYNDEMTATEDNPATVNVLANDQDVDLEYGDVITFVSLSKDASGLPGTFETNAEGDVTFTPNENYNGTFGIGYQMRDHAGLTSEAVITVTITPVNDKPTAGDDATSTKEDTAKDIDVSDLIGDVDILTNSDAISVSIKTIGEPQHGTATVDGTTITYTPNKDFNGTDEITYTVSDKAGETDTGKLTITVTAVNDAPTAEDDAKTTKEDTAVTILALDNDGDIDADELLNALPAAAPVIQSVSNGTHGEASTDGTTITYTPDENYNGTDTITYVLSDGEVTSSASISLTITQVNDPIQAANDAAKTNDEDLVTIDVMANDTDVDTDADLNKDVLHSRTDFSITAVGKPQHGKAEIVSGKIAYTPEDRYAGSDSFTYTVSDGKGTTAIATVNITVISVNDPPEVPIVSKPAEGDRAGTASKVEVVWTGFDIDGDVLIYQLEYFDGKSWTLVADKLTDTKYTFVIPDTLASTNGLKFRVNASDAEYTSDYGYSGAMKVDKDAPTGTIVTMRTADGRIYTAGTWTNQTVRVVASNAVDASNVTYLYAMDGGTSAAGTGMDVTTGVHTVNIVAKDEYGNAATVGGYLARVDKQQPATPAIKESVSASGTGVLITLTFQTDPGGSGNDRLTLPDGTTVNAAGNPTFTAAKNGTLNFSLTDVAGNRKAFTYTVSTVDTSKPTISLASGAYRIGTKTQSAIVATLTYTDAESELVTRGYQISESSKAGAAYKTYSGALTLNDAGTYYIHAFAKNAFGLTAYQTFGPFIIEEEATQTATPTPKQETGTVVVNKEDLEEVPGDTVSIRLPGQEWNETITLEDVGPGDYIVEAMDAEGNIRTVEVHVTMRDIIARSLRSAEGRANAVAIAALAIAIAAAIVFAFLASSYNITVTVFGTSAGADKKIRAMRRIKFRKKEMVIKLEDRHVTGGEYGNLKIAKQLSKKMRDNWVVMTIRGNEVLREQIPHDMDEAFQRKLTIEP